MKTRAILAGAVLSAALFISGAHAQEATFKIDLKGSNEVPANASKGTGTAVVTYNPGSRLLSWKVTYSGLTGPATMGHFHGPAELNTNAPVVIAFAKVDSPIEGSATLTDAQAADLAAGKYYINIHTAENKGGEIRGQAVTTGK
jgi:CHRD domain